MTEHTIIIKGSQYRPGALRIQPGDSVIWDNQDDQDHTATSDSRRIQFDTGIIKPGAKSKPIRFDAANAYGGVAFFCQCTGSIEGRLFVSSGGQPARKAVSAAESLPAPGVTYSVEVWGTIARIVAAHWIYDMADNFGYGKNIHGGGPLAQLNTEWSGIETYWQQQTGTTKTILDTNNSVDPSAFITESRENLEALGRRIRGARRRLRKAGVNIPQYPFPDRPDDPDTANPFGRLYGGQSNDPFGEAITVNYAGLTLSPDEHGVLLTEVQAAEVRHEQYALGPLWTIESKIDTGEPVTDDDKQAYQAARAALLISDYHVLAAHLYFGLSKLFNSADFQEDKFTTGIRRMTVRGEWDGSWQPMWHWLRWIDGYITVKKTGQLPDPLGSQ